MSEQQHSPLVRRCDVAIVGGSAAGLAAALQVQRQDRSVIVIDGGEPRNAPAAHMHGYLGFDGAPPSQLTTAGREEVRRYGGEILDGRVNDVDRDRDGFRLDAGGVTVLARRVVAATGVVDEFPAIEGIADHWGTTALHCPFCHGYEVRGQQLVQVITSPIGFHTASLFAHLSGSLTLVVAADLDIDIEDIASYQADGTAVVRGDVARVTNDRNGALAGVELDDGRRFTADAVVITTTLRPRIEPFLGLGLEAEPHQTGIADHVVTDETGETSVPGLYAAGNLTDPGQQVLAAAANGSQVGAMVAFDLAAEDRGRTGRPSATEAEWNRRYSTDEVWSGRANGALVAEMKTASPGRALDIGAGEGGDALWLAEQGWAVTATDLAPAGLERLAVRADAQGLAIRCEPVDANDRRAFGDQQYDLVSLFYSAIPRTGDDRAVANIMNAVAPGGTLLMVGHAPPSRDDPGHDRTTINPWDRASFVGVADLETAIRSAPGWEVETSELRERPPGSSTHHHHDRDVVLRATRHTEPCGARPDAD